MRRFLLVVSLIVLGFAVLTAGLWYLSRPDEPDAFYRGDAHGLPPGTLIVSESYARDVPEGARAWRILYATTRLDGSAATASAVVMVPRGAEGELLPVAWAHGTTGIAAGCAPSIVGPFNNVPALAELLEQGWAYVATDYAGLGTEGGHAYLVGEEAARGILDALRAARQMDEVDISDRSVVWGHSQGGNSALWTGMIASRYAPEVKIAGVAGMAPATDLPRLVEAVQATLFGKIVSTYVLKAYAAVYPDVRIEDYLGGYSAGLALDIAGRCAADARALFSFAELMLLPPQGLLDGDPSEGPLGARLAQNIPVGPFDMPVFIGQGMGDEVVPEPLQSRFVARLCEEGADLTYRRFEERDHVSLVAPDSALTGELVDWTRARFAGEDAPVGC